MPETPAPSAAGGAEVCCPAAYTCPTTGEVECLTHGGFDCCCADRSCPGYVRRSPWAWLRTWPRWAAVRVGYTIRPYDDLADARRWRWQRRQPCSVIDLDELARDDDPAVRQWAAALGEALDRTDDR